MGLLSLFKKKKDKEPKCSAVIVSAGAARRMGGIDKVLAPLGELPVLVHTLYAFQDCPAVDEIVEYGTAEPPKAGQPPAVSAERSPIANVSNYADGGGMLTLQSGEQLRFTAAKSMTATAYTTGYGGVGTRTASGTTVHVGTVAVDRKVIPLGTRLYIVTNDGFVYGLSVAEDTGVRGSKVDLYFDTYEECINFGRRGCTVYILA